MDFAYDGVQRCSGSVPGLLNGGTDFRNLADPASVLTAGDTTVHVSCPTCHNTF